MDKRKPIFEWQIVDQHAELQHAPWPPSVDTTANVPPVTGQRHRRAIYGSVIALLLLVGIAVSWLWHKGQAGLDQVEGELHTTIQTELTTATQHHDPSPTTRAASTTAWAWRHQVERENNTLQGAPTSAGLDGTEEIDVEMTNLQGDVAIANFVAPGTVGSAAYRQTRFYRSTSEGWLRIRPVAELWGAPRRLESAHFIFLFRQNDAQVVAEVAPLVDALYTKVQHSLGNAPRPEKLTVEVSVDATTGAFRTPAWPSEPLVVASPALYLAPAAISDADILAQSIALPLVEYMGNQAIQAYSIPLRWRPLLFDLQLWQLWHLQTPVARWRPSLVKWLYFDISTASEQQESVLPESYHELCAMLGLWMPSPVSIGAPLECSAMVLIARSPRHLADYVPPTQLEQLSEPLANGRNEWYATALYPYSSNDSIAVATLMEYAVSTYGDQQLPLFLAALAHNDTWDTLIPAVYGVSASAFEQGWHRYLSKEYGIQEDPLRAGHEPSSP
jgi:hypothetical protein